MTSVKVTSFLVELIEAIEYARSCESNEWDYHSHFGALQRCLEKARELLHFELTRAPTQLFSKQPKVSQEISKRADRQIESKRISLPDEVLNVIFSHFKDTSRHPKNLSSNTFNFSLVCKSWHRVANQRLWKNVHLSSRNSTILFGRSLHERHQYSATRAKGSPMSIGDGIRRLNVHSSAKIVNPALFAYVFDCVNLYTRNIVSLNLRGLSTRKRPLKVTEFYEIIKLHPHLKHVWLDEVELDSVEPLDPLPQLETCAFGFLRGPRVETLELISAKTISIGKINIFQKSAVKSVYFDGWYPFRWQVHEFQQVTHVHLGHFDDDDEVNDLLEGFSRIVKIPLLSFLVLKHLTFLTSNSFDLIADHCSLSTFVINWQPDEDSVDSWISCIQKMGPKLLSVGVGLNGDKYLDHPNIFQAIYQNCPNLMTLELYGNDSPSDAWPLQLYTSELENLCRLPLKWIYAPWFLEWPQNWKDRCPKFTKLCRLGLNTVLRDIHFWDRHLFDYNQPMRPAIIGDGFCS